jgi:hypothetical protein
LLIVVLKVILLIQQTLTFNEPSADRREGGLR